MVDQIQWEREYYSDGSLKWELPFVKSQLHGVAKGYHRDGTLGWETPWVNGQLHGVVKHYCRDGSLECETEFYYGLDVYEYLGNKRW